MIGRLSRIERTPVFDRGPAPVNTAPATAAPVGAPFAAAGDRQVGAFHVRPKRGDQVLAGDEQLRAGPRQVRVPDVECGHDRLA